MTTPDRAHLRIARPTADMDAAVRFWVDGVGMDLYGRKAGDGGSLQELAFVGWPTAPWHLEIVRDTQIQPSPTPEDLVVLYLDEPVDDELLARIAAEGGTRTPARNDWWDQGGVTFADPDGYLLVLTSRTWTGTP